MYVYKNVLVYLCKRYLVYLYERFLYICANANPFCSRTSHVTRQAKTPPAQPTRHDVIHAIFQCVSTVSSCIYDAVYHKTVQYMLQYTTSPSQSAQAPKTQNLPKFPTCDRHRWEEGDVCAMLRRAKAD